MRLTSGTSAFGVTISKQGKSHHYIDYNYNLVWSNEFVATENILTEEIVSHWLHLTKPIIISDVIGCSRLWTIHFKCFTSNMPQQILCLAVFNSHFVYRSEECICVLIISFKWMWFTQNLTQTIVQKKTIIINNRRNRQTIYY